MVSTPSGMPAGNSIQQQQGLTGSAANVPYASLDSQDSVQFTGAGQNPPPQDEQTTDKKTDVKFWVALAAAVGLSGAVAGLAHKKGALKDALADAEAKVSEKTPPTTEVTAPASPETPAENPQVTEANHLAMKYHNAYVDSLVKDCRFDLPTIKTKLQELWTMQGAAIHPISVYSAAMESKNYALLTALAKDTGENGFASTSHEAMREAIRLRDFDTVSASITALKKGGASLEKDGESILDVSLENHAPHSYDLWKTFKKDFNLDATQNAALKTKVGKSVAGLNGNIKRKMEAMETRQATLQEHIETYRDGLDSSNAGKKDAITRILNDLKQSAKDANDAKDESRWYFWTNPATTQRSQHVKKAEEKTQELMKLIDDPAIRQESTDLQDELARYHQLKTTLEKNTEFQSKL